MGQRGQSLEQVAEVLVYQVEAVEVQRLLC